MEGIIEEVKDERSRQIDKWGKQTRNFLEWTAILTEEVGEVAKETVDYTFRYGKHRKGEPTLVSQRENIKRYRDEMIQVAAVAIAAIEDLDEQWNPHTDPTEEYWARKS